MTLTDRTSLRSLYLYLVCLVTLLITIFAAVSLVRNLVSLAYPDPGYYGVTEPARPDGTGRPSAKEQARQEQAARDSQRHQSVLGLTGAGTALLIAGPVYLYHWRRVRQELPTGRLETVSE